MRKKLIATSFSVAALVGVAGGVALADDSDPAAAPTTTMIAGDVFAELGLTPEQSQCLLDNMSGVDFNDMTALAEWVTQCGVTTEQLIEIGQSMGASTPTDPGASTTADGSTTPGALDPAAAQAVLDLLGVDATELACISTALAAAPPVDDNAALAALQGCGLSLSELLTGLAAVDAEIQAGGATTTSAPGAEGTGESNAMVDMLQEQLQAQGITLTDEQAQCILDHISEFDMNDLTSVMGVLETCGINLQDIVPGG